jgi:hypothetical protein
MTTPQVRIVPPATTGLLKDLPYGTVVHWYGGPCVVVYQYKAPNNRGLVSLANTENTWGSMDKPLPILGRLEVVNGTPEVKATSDNIQRIAELEAALSNERDLRDHDREQIVHWQTEARAQRERAEKYLGWLLAIVNSGPIGTGTVISCVSCNMRKDGPL